MTTPTPTVPEAIDLIESWMIDGRYGKSVDGLHASCRIVLDELTRVQAELQKAEGQRDRLANDALVALAGHVCTPEEGYIKAPHCLASDIGSLVKRLNEAAGEIVVLREQVNQHMTSLNANKAFSISMRRELKRIFTALEFRNCTCPIHSAQYDKL